MFRFFSFSFLFHFWWFIFKGASKKISKRPIFLLNSSSNCVHQNIRCCYTRALFYFTSWTVISTVLVCVCMCFFVVNFLLFFLTGSAISLTLKYKADILKAKGANEILRLPTHYKVSFINKITVRKWLENRGIDDFQHLGLHIQIKLKLKLEDKCGKERKSHAINFHLDKIQSAQIWWSSSLFFHKQTATLYCVCKSRFLDQHLFHSRSTKLCFSSCSYSLIDIQFIQFSFFSLSFFSSAMACNGRIITKWVNDNFYY